MSYVCMFCMLMANIGFRVEYIRNIAHPYFETVYRIDNTDFGLTYHTLALMPHISLQLGTVYYGPGGVIQRVEDDPDDSASDNDDPAYYG